MEYRLRTWDVLVPAVILAVGLLELVLVRPAGWGYAVGLETVATGILVFRRRNPLIVGTAAALVILTTPWAGPALNDISTPIFVLALICYSFARWIPSLRGLLGLAAIMLFFLVDYALADSREHDFTDVIFLSALVVPPYVFGRITRRLAVQSEQLALQQELIRDQAARDERDRIARELHDVIAHSLSAMVVQTAAAQDLVPRDPGRALVLLDAVAEAGRAALAETGRLLHLVRDDADELGLRPAPGLADLPELVASCRAGGLDLDAEIVLPTQQLPGGVDVSAYRVVQEALTNATKYADGPVRLRVDASAGRLRISCVNRVGPRRADGAGLGLQGMAERVALLGGTLRTGAEDGRDFAVDVDIPLAGASA